MRIPERQTKNTLKKQKYITKPIKIPSFPDLQEEKRRKKRRYIKETYLLASS
jgi:hypothetical protein